MYFNSPKPTWSFVLYLKCLLIWKTVKVLSHGLVLYGLCNSWLQERKCTVYVDKPKGLKGSAKGRGYVLFAIKRFSSCFILYIVPFALFWWLSFWESRRSELYDLWNTVECLSLLHALFFFCHVLYRQLDFLESCIFCKLGNTTWKDPVHLVILG